MIPSPLRRDDLGFLLAKAAQHWNDLLAEGFAAAGYVDVRPSYGSVLIPLYEENGLQMGELARRSRLSEQTMTPLVRRVERDGFVVRTRIRRTRGPLVSLTAKARSFEPVAARVLEDVNARVRELLPPRRSWRRRVRWASQHRSRYKRGVTRSVRGTATSPLVLPAVLIATALAAWIVVAGRTGGMAAEPGADLGGLAAFLGLWVTMMTAMMLPAVLPVVLLYARIARHRGGSIAVFLGGYLAAWTAIGIGAYLAARGVRAVDPGRLAWDAAGRWIAAGAVVAAGIYQLTPLKSLCLRHCRGPVQLVMGGWWRDGRAGALRMGLEHGRWCVGCCAGLFAALFALGLMSLVWMAAVAAVIFAEKVLPGGERVARVVAVGLVGLGIWIALAPASVPGLVEPGTPPLRMS